jgi:hypothetical protein
MARVSSDHNPVLHLALARLRHPAKGRFTHYYEKWEHVMFNNTILLIIYHNRLSLRIIVSLRSIYLLAVFFLLNIVSCGEEPTAYKLNQKIPLGLGNLTVYSVEYDTLRK